MNHALAHRMYMNTTATKINHSQAVRLDGRSNVVGALEVMNGSTDVMVVKLGIEVSDDLDNWRDSGITEAAITGRHGLDQTGDIPVGGGGTAPPLLDAQYVRARWSLDPASGGTARAIIRSGIDVARVG